MITPDAGDSSYYGDYLRKRGTSNVNTAGRSVPGIPALTHSAPSLMTDRGAYLNFLESQLERVTSACLTVQSVENRFDDMHSLLRVSEQRVLANSKLLALAQQCTEVSR
jgi:hypothetical protein